MNFILDNLFIIIIAASGLVQWWRSTQEAKRERENPSGGEEYCPQHLEEFLEQAERRLSRPAVPPPLPMVGGLPPQPSFDRNPAPALKKSRPTSEAKAFVMAPHYAEEALEAELARQALIAEQLSGIKQARKKQAPMQTTQRDKAPAVASGSLRDRLKNRLEIRQAFVLKEILDKPVGLR
jgi:hypothetical protein